MRVHIVSLNSIIQASIALSIGEFAQNLQATIKLDGREIPLQIIAGQLINLVSNKAKNLIEYYRLGHKTSLEFEAELQDLFDNEFNVKLDTPVFWQCWNKMLTAALNDPELIVNRLNAIKNKCPQGKEDKVILISETNAAHMQVFIDFCLANNIQVTENNQGLHLHGLPLYLSYKPDMQQSKLDMAKHIAAKYPQAKCVYQSDTSKTQTPEENSFTTECLSKLGFTIAVLDLDFKMKDWVAVSTSMGVEFKERSTIPGNRSTH